MFRRLAVFAVKAVPVDEAADTTHGPAGIGEGGAEIQVVRLHKGEGRTQFMTPEKYCEWLHCQVNLRIHL